VLDILTLTWPLLVGVLASFGLSVLLVLTTRWHGAFSMDESSGIQKVHARPTPRIGGLLVGAKVILLTVVVQFVYAGTAAALTVSLLLMVALYKRMMANFGR
jgi:UDP-N-acetylmuramyl pentapeptide phosphotransferase/UDP-N-acetylglucosamine-1-phosphate transferase